MHSLWLAAAALLTGAGPLADVRTVPRRRAGTAGWSRPRRSRGSSWSSAGSWAGGPCGGRRRRRNRGRRPGGRRPPGRRPTPGRAGRRSIAR